MDNTGTTGVTEPGTPSNGARAAVALGWIFGCTGILIGALMAIMDPVFGLGLLAFSAILLPPVFRRLRSLNNVAPYGALAVTFIVMVIGGRQLGKAMRADMQRTRDSINAVRAAEYRQDSLAEATFEIIAKQHWYVDHADFTIWYGKARDSTSDPSLTLARFLEREKQERAKYVADSTATAKAEAKKELHARWAAEAAQRQYESESRSSSAGGREIHVGKRGGRYYISESGKKVYVD